MPHRAWNKGFTKETNVSVRRISDTMRRKRVDNFKEWRDTRREEGSLPDYGKLKQNGDLAELIGVTLGDGSIHKYARTEGLRIVSNANNQGFIERYANIVERVFEKKPSVTRRRQSNAVDIRLYQKHISSRLCIPAGARAALNIKVPLWIGKKKPYLIRFLRGLYEAEGSYCVHAPTYTYKFLFSNSNASMRKIVFDFTRQIGFHPHISGNQVQLSKREEVGRIRKLLKFREY
jgi:hypothetical protein